MSRPNFLVLMADQLAARWLPAYGHPVVQAPNLSALAGDGVRFNAAYCPSPLCAPSRSAMLAGRRCSRIGVFDNAAELPASVPTYAHYLRSAGYQTSLAGKMHFVGPDQLHGFEQRLTPDVYPAGVEWTPDWRQPVSARLPWYHTMESVLTPARTTASMQTDYDDEVAFHAVRHIHDLARAADERPFLLVVSFTNPHDPWEIPPRYWDLYDPSAIEPPAVGEIAQDPHSRRLREMCGADEVELPEEQVLRARHAYYAAISYVDERIGMVLHALRETGLDESTVVAFTADHGEMLGERGLWYKMSLFDGSARVPLIFRGPGVVAESVVSSPASLLDLAPTLLELAGAASTGADLDGRSLVPALTGERDASLVPALAGEGDASLAPVICEYHAEGVNHPAAMVRSGAHKLIVCPGDPDQLYDLEADPHELANLSGRPEVGDVEAQLHSELSARLDLADIEARVLASQRDRRLVADALGRGTATSWDYRPEAPMRYVRSRADLYELQRRARLETRTEPEQQPA